MIASDPLPGMVQLRKILTSEGERVAQQYSFWFDDDNYLSEGHALRARKKPIIAPALDVGDDPIEALAAAVLLQAVHDRDKWFLESQTAEDLAVGLGCRPGAWGVMVAEMNRTRLI